VFLLGACKKNNSSTSPCAPETIETYFQINKSLATTVRGHDGQDPKPYDYQVQSGQNILFTYDQRFMNCPDVSDDEGARMVFIEIPADKTEFTIENSSSGSKVLMVNQCFCYDAYPHLITKGKVTGKRISFNRWEIEATLYSTADQTSPFYFKKIFTLKN
jgi:hypothetical protein